MVYLFLDWQGDTGEEYMNRVKHRLEGGEYRTEVERTRMFLVGRVAKFRGLWVVRVGPRAPPMWVFLPGVMAGLFLFGVRSPWPYVGLGVFSLIGAMWWTPWVYYRVLRWGYSREYGVPPRVDRLGWREATRRFLEWGS